MRDMAKEKGKKAITTADVVLFIGVIVIILGVYYIMQTTGFKLEDLFSFQRKELAKQMQDEMQKKEGQETAPTTEREIKKLTKKFLEENCKAKLKKECQKLDFNDDNIGDCYFVFLEASFRGICKPIMCSNTKLQSKEICERYTYCKWLEKTGVCRSAE